MTSRARIVFARRGGRTRVVTVAASAPQRWTVGAAADGWLTVYHQLVGDGYFPAERCLTRCEVGPGARAIVEGVTATPLRPGAASLAALRLRVGPGGALIYRPGALLPHAGAAHGAALDAAVDAEGALAVIQVWTAGRTAHEAGRFQHLAMRTRLAVGATPVLHEQLLIAPCDWPQGDPVVLTITALGAWAPAHPGWWEPLLPGRSADGAATPLGQTGALVRALFPSLGAASAFAEATVSAMRKAVQMKNCSYPGKLPETDPKGL